MKMGRMLEQTCDLGEAGQHREGRKADQHPSVPRSSALTRHGGRRSHEIRSLHQLAIANNKAHQTPGG